MVIAAMKLKDAYSWRESYDQPRQHLKSRDIILSTKVCLVKAMVFPESCMDVRVGPYRKLSAKELMLLNCGAGENS